MDALSSAALTSLQISIREEVREIETGKMDRHNNPLKNAPHPAEVVSPAACSCVHLCVHCWQLPVHARVRIRL